ncbi:MAG: hypothetical protein KJ630_07795 [Proteobacteria bacterium]|nr:hypothetical protein [Pseudomonadota bacterium]
MKNVFQMLFVISILSLAILCNAKERTIGYFDHNYNGVYPGFSSLETVYKRLGKPLRVEAAGGGWNYVFKKVKVNFPGGDNSNVNTIIIYNDYEYIDPNGFSLGDKVNDIGKAIGVDPGQRDMTDIKNGVICWHNGQTVTRIVLPYSFYID